MMFYRKLRRNIPTLSRNNSSSLDSIQKNSMMPYTSVKEKGSYNLKNSINIESIEENSIMCCTAKGKGSYNIKKQQKPTLGRRKFS